MAFLRHAENDLDDLRSYFDSLDECADHVSAPLPVGGCQVRPDCGRELAKTSRRESQVFQVMGIATFLCGPPYALRIKSSL